MFVIPALSKPMVVAAMRPTTPAVTPLLKAVENKALHVFNDGVTAGVVGLIAATTIGLLKAGITSIYALGIFLLSLLVIYRWKSKLSVIGVVIGAGVISLLLKNVL